MFYYIENHQKSSPLYAFEKYDQIEFQLKLFFLVTSNSSNFILSTTTKTLKIKTLRIERKLGERDFLNLSENGINSSRK